MKIITGKTEGDQMRWRVAVCWTQWMFGFWWWQVKKDLAFGIEIGPLHIQRIRRYP